MKFTSKFTSIRQKLIFYFVSIILTLASVSIIFGLLHLVIVGKYKQIEDNIFLQYHLIDTTEKLIIDYNDYRNVSTTLNLDKYLALHKEILDTISVLKQRIVNEDSKVALKIVENTIKNVLAETDRGIEVIQSSQITDTAFYYVEANRKFDFVKSNTEDLILKEIDYSRVLALDIQKTQELVIVFGSILLFAITLLSIILSIFWAGNFVLPLLKISSIAKLIAGGDFEIHVDEKLLNSKDEIGDLSKAFNDMTIKLKESRVRLEEQIKETQKKSITLEEKVNELERMNKLMVDRELKMIELKKEIEELKRKSLQ